MSKDFSLIIVCCGRLVSKYDFISIDCSCYAPCAQKIFHCRCIETGHLIPKGGKDQHGLV